MKEGGRIIAGRPRAEIEGDEVFCERARRKIPLGILTGRGGIGVWRVRASGRMMCRFVVDAEDDDVGVVVVIAVVWCALMMMVCWQ